MIRTKHIRVASVVAGTLLSLCAVAPLAHADDVDNLRGTVNGDRLKYGPGCAPLKYNQALQDIAFAQGQLIPAPNVDALIGGYPGQVRSFIGTGDPIAAATNDAYKKGAGGLVGNCDWTEFGVSFNRFESEELDFVGIVFGKPNAAAPAPAGGGTPAGGGATPGGGGTPPVAQVPVAVPVTCPAGSPKTEVPAGQTCPEPKDAIAVSFDTPAFSFTWTVNVSNSSSIAASCTYDATAVTVGPPRHEDFEIGANGSKSFDVPSPGVLKYDTVTVCTGTYDGRQIQLGRVEKRV